MKISEELLEWYDAHSDDFIRILHYPTRIVNTDERDTFFPLLREFEQLANKKYTTKNSDRLLITYHSRLLKDVVTVQEAYLQSDLYKQREG